MPARRAFLCARCASSDHGSRVTGPLSAFRAPAVSIGAAGRNSESTKGETHETARFDVRFCGMSVPPAPARRLDRAAGSTDDDEFREQHARPRETVALRVPGAAASGALTAERRHAGARCSARRPTGTSLTRAVTAIVNGGTVRRADAGAGRSSTSRRPASTATPPCGARTASRSAPNTWRLTVTRVEPHVFNWTLDGKRQDRRRQRVRHHPVGHAHARRRRRRPPDRGLRQRHVRRRLGHGADAARARRRNVGRRDVHVFAPRPRRPSTTIDVDFTGHQGRQDRARSTTPSTATRRRRARAASSGTPRTRTTSPIRHRSGTAKEHFTIHSRWQETGAGRSDIQLTGGDLTTAV